jgi:cysteine desulfurase/selenocysteine lyase
MSPDIAVSALRKEIVGIETRVPVLDGTERPYVFLDNAASTPTFHHVMNVLAEYLPWYSGVHRGTGFKSLLSTAVFDGAHDAVGRFVGVDLAANTVIFTKNTTECINKLANRFTFRRGDVVITSLMEHHSNDLPWRKHVTVVHTGVGPDGQLDVAALRTALQKHAGRVRLVAINGASNISGLCSPLRDIAHWTHEAGALLFVDAAQLAPHRPIRMLADDDPAHIDFLALSAHKMYAPFGTGALIGPKRFFEEGDPDSVGGGVVEVVTLETAVWNHPPHKEEAGSPNVPGGVALAAAIDVLQRVGMEAIAEHEHALLTYAYGKLKGMKGLRLYGPTDNLRQKVGVITFNVEGMHHALAAAILGVEGGIGVRNGCFCAHPYVKELLHVSPEDDHRLTAEVMAGNKANMPGMVRASFGCFNNQEDVDRLVDMLGRVVRKEYRGTYHQNRASGAFHAEGFAPDFSRYFQFASSMIPGEDRGVSEAS